MLPAETDGGPIPLFSFCAGLVQPTRVASARGSMIRKSDMGVTAHSQIGLWLSVGGHRCLHGG